MTIPCLKSESRCTPCAGDSSNPFANLSLEPFDRNIWLGIYFGRPVNVTPNTWTTDACVGFCESAISQTDADDCARRRAEDCVQIEPPYDDPPPPEPPITPALFCNQEVSCQSGSSCYTIPACTVFAGSQAEADAIAQSLCNSRVLDSGLSSPCAALPPEPPPVVPLDCPSESGAAAPESLEITEEVMWIASQVITVPPWVVDGVSLRLPAFDLPPGEYKINNLDGYFDRPTGGTCAVGDATTLLYPSLIDAEGQILLPAQCNTSASGVCASPSDEDEMRVNCEADVNFNPGGQRLNGTGTCSFEVDSDPAIGGGGYTVGQTHVFSLKQPTGLIPQPRKLQIASYSTPLFADPAGAAGWNGAFDTRDFYTAVGLRWEAPAAGAFGGAQLEYTMSHPTSASGKGWMLNIYSAGFVLMWRGYKAVGSTSIGRYYRDSTATPVGPACLTCTDASDDQWFP